MSDAPSIPGSKVCPKCGREFPVKPHNYDKRTYCSRVCKVEASRGPRPEKGSAPSKAADQKSCPVCNGTFRPFVWWQRCCSVVCAQTYRSRAGATRCQGVPRRDDRVPVTCEFGVSPRCRRQWEVSRRAAEKNRARNNGKLICMPCSRLLKNAGRNNPNCRYKALQDDYFQEIESEEKAYLLGWIASDGSINKKNSIAIAIHQKDEPLLKQLRDLLSPDLPLYRKGNLVGLRFCSLRMTQDVCRWLAIQPGKKSRTVGFPDLSSESLKWAFLRGYFDGDGHVSSLSSKTTVPRCGIASSSPRLRRAIQEFCGIPCSDSGESLEWSGNNALDFLSRLYDDATIYLPRKWEAYQDWCFWVPGLTGHGRSGRDPLFHWIKTDVRAVPPSKERASDSGYDLTLIEKAKTIGKVDLYTTGIRIQPEFGWYFDLVARSSIARSGYMMVNGIGVIDRTYQGPVMAALMKVDPDAPDLELPSRLVQLIPRPIVHVRWTEVESLDATERGEGGFGSTGRR